MEINKQKMPSGNDRDGYIGTYYSESSKGVYHFTFNEESGEITEPELFYTAENAKWVSLNGDSLVFPIEKEGKAGTCFLKLENGSIKSSEEVLEEKQTPCYIHQDGEFVYTANYHEGTVMVYRLKDGKTSVEKRIENGEEAGCHQILLHDTYLMVPCLIQNKIRLFDRQNGFLPMGEICFPEGTGPRHGVFNKAHTKFYVVSEWSNELFIFKVDGSAFKLQQALSVLPESEKEGMEDAASAAVRLTKDERFLYVSVRGRELLAVIDVSQKEAAVIQHVSCGGRHPRDFILSENERFLITVNRFEGGMVSMERDCNSGKIKDVVSRSAMPEGVSVVLEEVLR